MTSPISSTSQYHYQYYIPLRSAASGETGTAERLAPAQGLPPASSPPPTAGYYSGMSDASKVDGLGRMLDMDAGAVSQQARSATDLIELMQNRGIDLGQLRNVLNSGDLLDVRA